MTASKNNSAGASKHESLLIELGTEDLPARYVAPLAEALGNGITTGLNKRGLVANSHKIFATPRRIAVLVENVALQQPDQKLERQGPALSAALKDGKPTPAALGFAKSCGVEFSGLGEKDGKLYFSKTAPGKPIAELLPEIFEETLKQIDELVPKRMRWADGTETFVRPVQWIVAMLGNQVIPLRRFGLDSGAMTYGHRFHAPDVIHLRTAADYEDVLKRVKVWADFGSRKAEIKRQIEMQAAKLKGTARITEELLDEVTALVEWPVAISGHMEERFMQLPPEVIIATVETNQRYFTVFDAHNKLLPVFIAISNIESKDVSQVISGNERVVRPRLTDAMFFWERDLEQPLEAYGARLATVTFQKELGTIADKVGRIGQLAVQIGQQLKADIKTVERAAVLCKNDLVTKMVYEFPELQGVMGGYYAEKSGESAEIAAAIREHYLPTQQGTPIPANRSGQIVALADKLDTLAGIFAIGQKPTASKDPFGLRRAALGITRICIEGQLTLNPKWLLTQAIKLQPVRTDSETLLNELSDFLGERLRSYLGDNGFRGEFFEAVKATSNAIDYVNFMQRLRALADFWKLPAAKNLSAAHKRVRNILKQAGNTGAVVNEGLFEQAAEKTLWTHLVALKQTNATADYSAKLMNLADLREPVDAFFESVMVNVKNEAVRENRIALLRELDATCREVADISCLPG